MILLIMLLVATGCGNGKNAQPAATNTNAHDATVNNNTKHVVPVNSDNANVTIIGTDSFLKTYKNWAGRLEEIAQKTNEQYGELINNKTTTDKFLNNITQIYAEMESLKNNNLLTDFNLTTSEKKNANYDQITKDYAHASKDLNDFLYYAPHLKKEELQAKYDILIKNKYNNDIVTLNKDLKI